VGELWFVDKDRREISVFRLGDSLAKPAAVFGEREELTSALFPGLRLRLAEVFAD
jgi:Uma2 family endonuclease